MLAVALTVGAVGFSLGLAFQGQASDEPAPSAALASLQERAGALVVYSEFGEWADTLWAADPDDPSDRVFLGSIEHAYGYGISPSLSPDGARVAYTVLSAGAAGYGAELWVRETNSGATKRLAPSVDLLATPAWSPASDGVVARRSGQGEASAGAELLRVDLQGSVSSLASAAGGLYAIDFAPDGQSLYYASLSQTGSDLMRVAAAGGAPEHVAHLSDGFARDWRLSADGTRLAYLAESPDARGATYSTRVLDLASGGAKVVSAGEPQFNPIWDRSGALTVGRPSGATVRMSVDGGSAAAVSLPPLPGPTSGFDVPIAWSPDGAHLVVRHFAGGSGADPGPSSVVITSVDGSRRELSPLSDIAIAGWLEPPA